MSIEKSVLAVRICKGLVALTLLGSGAAAGRGHPATMVIAGFAAAVFYALSWAMDPRK